MCAAVCYNVFAFIVYFSIHFRRCEYLLVLIIIMCWHFYDGVLAYVTGMCVSALVFLLRCIRECCCVLNLTFPVTLIQSSF